MEVPREVIFRHAFSVAAKYFAERIEEERRSGRVAVLVKDMAESLYFLPCNEGGYPQYYQMKTIELPRLEAFLTVGDIDKVPSTITVHEITIYCSKPLLTQSYDYNEPPIVFMWEGKKMGTEHVPMEKLNVSELMRVAQVAIQKREGLVIDDALRNKIYK